MCKMKINDLLCEKSKNKKKENKIKKNKKATKKQKKKKKKLKERPKNFTTMQIKKASNKK